jgi:hypothetical protein
MLDRRRIHVGIWMSTFILGWARSSVNDHGNGSR